MSRKTIRIAVLSVGIIIFVFILVLLSRPLFFNIAVHKANRKLAGRYNAEFSIGSAKFSGISKISIQSLRLSNPGGDTLVFIDSLAVQVKVIDLLAKRLRFKYVNINQLSVSINRADITTLDIEKSDTLKAAQKSDRSYVASLNRVSGTLFSLFPDRVIIDSITIALRANEGCYHFASSGFKMLENKYQSNFEVYDPFGAMVALATEGIVDPHRKNIEGVLYRKSSNSDSKQLLHLPYDINLQIDTLRIGLQVIELSRSEFICQTAFKLKGLQIKQPKLSPNMVLLDSAAFYLITKMNNEFIEIDSSSSLTFNKVKINPFFNFKYNGDNRVLFKILPVTLNSAEIINSLPIGIFENISGIKAKGSFDYNFAFGVNLNNPDTVILESKITDNRISISQFGKANLYQLTDTFTHKVYDEGVWVRNIFIGESNSNYVSLSEISPYVINSVLTAEDGGFYYHRGFDTEGIKLAIRENLKQGRFARGGSTISQQLIKNLYLNQQKTVTRKLEEVILVYLLENLKIVSKDQMLEIYLNIIEWGPNVYGIHEAAVFYFNKTPKQLTLDESIFLASVIPSPKRFNKSFDKEGNLRNYYNGYFNFLINTMLLRGTITADDTTNLFPIVNITGPAINFTGNLDTVSAATDSLDYQL